MTKKIIQSIGNITKKETLRLVEQLNNCNSLILESTEPFPGYHGTTVPDKLDPDSIFLVTRYAYNDDRIIRAIMAVKKTFPFRFDAAPGSLYLNNKPVNIIRIKFLPYHHVPELIEIFQDHEIDFMKKRRINPYDSLIKIRKHFRMEESVEGIYQDMDTKEFSYLQIPCAMRWNTFEKITMQIKYNIKDNNFDAAMGHVYDANGLLDFVRIYDKNFKLGKLIFIRNKYLDFIGKL